MAENFDAIIEKEAELHGTHVGDDQTSTNSGEDVVKVFNAIQEEIKYEIEHEGAMNMEHIKPSKGDGNDSDSDKEDPEEKKRNTEMQMILSPGGKAMKYYERAKVFYTNCEGRSIELEIVLRDIAAATAYSQDFKHYYFLAKVFKQSLDFTSCIYCLRNVMKMNNKFKPARIMLGETLMLKAREVMAEAVVANQRLKEAKLLMAALQEEHDAMVRAVEEEKKKKEVASLNLDNIATHISKKREESMTMDDDFDGSNSVGGDSATVNTASTSKNINKNKKKFKVPKKVEEHVKSLFRIARVYFDESLEYDRDHYEALMFRAICTVQLGEFVEANEMLGRAIHLVGTKLKELYPQEKLKKSSADVISYQRSSRSRNRSRATSSQSAISNSSAYTDDTGDREGESRESMSRPSAGPGSANNNNNESRGVVASTGIEITVSNKSDKKDQFQTSDSMNNTHTTASVNFEGADTYIYSEDIAYDTPEIATEAKKTTRQLAELIIMRGKLAWSQGLTENGNKDMRRASLISPDHVEVKKFGLRSYVRADKIYKMCLVAFKKRDYEEALRLINMAVSISAVDVKLLVQQAKVYRNLDNLEEAFGSIQRATNLFQNEAMGFEMKIPEAIMKETNLILNDMALRAAGEGEYDKSIALMNKVITAENSLFTSNGVGLGGGTDEDKKDTSTTSSSKNRFNSHSFTEGVDYRFLVNRGDCYRALSQYGMALLDYDSAMFNLKKNKLGASSGVPGARREWMIGTRLSVTYYMVACESFNESNFEDSEVQLCKAIEYNPKVSEYFHTRGKARYYLGMYQLAYEDFKETLRLDPNNQQVKQRLKQFMTNVSANIGSKNDENASASAKILKKLQQLIEEDNDVSGSSSNEKKGMTIEEARNNHREMEPIEVTTEAQVDMLLNPQSARLLPEVASQRQKLVTVPVGTLAYQQQMLSSRVANMEFGHSILPLINEKCGVVALAAAANDKKEEAFYNVMNTKYDTTKSQLWTMFNNAKQQARNRSKPVPGHDMDESMKPKKIRTVTLPNGDVIQEEEDDDMESVYSMGGTRKLVPKSYTASGLKRFSMKQTQKALKRGGLIHGVLTHKNDPYLHAVSDDKTGIKQQLTINVTARPRVSKWAKGKRLGKEADDGGVDTFDSYNMLDDIMSETKSGNWREALRQQQKAEEEAKRRAHQLEMKARQAAVQEEYQREIDAAEDADPNSKKNKRLRKEARRKAREEKRVAAEAAAAAAGESEAKALEDNEKRKSRRRKSTLGAGSFDDEDDEEDYSSEEENRLEVPVTDNITHSSIASFLASQGLDDKNSMNKFLTGDGIDILAEEGEHDSSLITMTEEQELQLAYEARIKAEHEEQRRKRQERREELRQKELARQAELEAMNSPLNSPKRRMLTGKGGQSGSNHSTPRSP